MKIEHIKASDGLQVGDVISLGRHWSVPPQLEKCFFRVESIIDERVNLSVPYKDVACTAEYREYVRGTFLR